MRPLDLQGQTFGRLKVVACVGPDQGGSIRWQCVCECGREKNLRGADLKRGFIKSCGCLNSDVTASRNATHHQSHTRLYRIWQAMRDRTSNPLASRYPYYGGRGITVCVEWQDFLLFATWAHTNGYRDPGEGEPRSQHLTIDRIDVDGNYQPQNCRWVVQRVQVLNRGLSRKNISGHKGVSRGTKNRWVASASMPGGSKYLGIFETVEEAAIACASAKQADHQINHGE
jgi:hypothetical protein